MRTTKATFLTLILAMALAVPATSLAQRQRNREELRRDRGFAGSGGRGLDRNFEAVAPALGEAMPDVVVYDAEGTPHRLPELLRGHYSVLILGCLT